MKQSPVEFHNLQMKKYTTGGQNKVRGEQENTQLYAPLPSPPLSTNHTTRQTRTRRWPQNQTQPRVQGR